MSTDKTAGQQPEGRTARRRPTAEAEQEQKDLAAGSERHDGAVTAKKDRPTPSRRKEEEEEEDSGNIVTRTGSGIREYLEGVRSEIGKVVWPTRDDAQRLTLIVLISLIVSSAALGAIAFLFTEIFRIGLDAPLLLFVVMAIGIAGGLLFNRIYGRKPTAL
ncbi:MAG: preprotein translocase subunit SecE [Anaerolineae bacterium]